MIHIESAGFVLFTQKNGAVEYLLLHYPTGHWDFPKGKIEPGESRHQAAVRELYEETGLRATVVDGFAESVFYEFTRFDGTLAIKTVYFFIAQTQETAIVLSHEHTGYAWLPYQEALARLTYDNAKLMLQKAKSIVDAVTIPH